MGILGNLKKDDAITEAADSVGGFSALDSGVYKVTIKVAYLTKSTNGAMCLNLQLETDDGKAVNGAIYITSGDKKGNKTTYTDKKGDEQYLPGFSLGNSLANLVLNQDLSELEDETRTINLWNFDANGEIPTKIDALLDLHGKKVEAGIILQLNDKNYLKPDGQIRKSNEIDRFFDIDSNMTSSEIAKNASTPSFIHTWIKKWKGEVRDRVTKNIKAATNGAPAPSGKSLFED